MSTIGGAGGTTTSVPASGPAAPAALAAPSAGAALRDPRLAAQPALAEVAAGARTLALGERGDHVKAVQDVLQACGYGVGRALTAGVLDRVTESLLSQFQRDKGLPTSGALG